MSNTLSRLHATLDSAISKVYPWTTFPVPIEVFAFDIFRHMMPSEDLQASSEDPNGKLARYLRSNFWIEVSEELVAGQLKYVYVLPEAPRRRRAILKSLQSARDAELLRCQ